jgi:hypothetical protein
MKDALEPHKKTTCMKCRKRDARYYGKWAEEGLCRSCVEQMGPSVRRRIIRDMHPEDRSRWKLDGLMNGKIP